MMMMISKVVEMVAQSTALMAELMARTMAGLGLAAFSIFWLCLNQFDGLSSRHLKRRPALVNL